MISVRCTLNEWSVTAFRMSCRVGKIFRFSNKHVIDEQVCSGPNPQRKRFSTNDRGAAAFGVALGRQNFDKYGPTIKSR